MERLFRISDELIRRAPSIFERYMAPEIEWDAQLLGLSGARGSGKTILLLQHARSLPKGKKTLYVSLDDVYFTENKLIHFVESFIVAGGEYLMLDEVHKYPNWSQELKNIYDYYPDLKVAFTSSSALEIHKGQYDLSRRAELYKLHGLSFREFVALKYKTVLPIYSLSDIVSKHDDICNEILGTINPLPLFKEYLESGYYPFFVNAKKNYLRQLMNTVNLAIEVDLPSIHHIDYRSILKIKKLVAILARLVPYKPNIEQLAKQVETTRDSLLKYLYYLDTAGIIKWLGSDTAGINYLNKPEKIYLNNSNLNYALGNYTQDIGNIRETFFINQLSVNHTVTYPKNGDFLIDGEMLFEVGGKNKGFLQIKNMDNSFVAADDILHGLGNKIPLWLFGFMY